MAVLIALLILLIIISGAASVLGYETFLAEKVKLRCESGYELDEVNGICKICKEGQYSYNNKCYECPNGTTSFPGSHTCLNRLNAFKHYSDYTIFYDSVNTPYILDNITNNVYLVDVTSSFIISFNRDSSQYIVNRDLLCYYNMGNGNCSKNSNFVSYFDNNIVGASGTSSWEGGSTGSTGTGKYTIPTPVVTGYWSSYYENVYNKFKNASIEEKKEIISNALSSYHFNPQINLEEMTIYDPITKHIWKIDYINLSVINTTTKKIIYFAPIKYLIPSKS